jgi:hypothetical protein
MSRNLRDFPIIQIIDDTSMNTKGIRPYIVAEWKGYNNQFTASESRNIPKFRELGMMEILPGVKHYIPSTT